jgi:hypothetical protein
MSMIARFVAITPDQLATIKDTPGLPFESPSDLQERLRRQAPQLVADMLKRLPPAVRQQLRRRLGLGQNDLPNPGASNAVLLQLAQREPARRRAPPAPGAPGHSFSLDKAWAPLPQSVAPALARIRQSTGREDGRGKHSIVMV